VTLIFIVAAFALIYPAYLWALHLQDEREKSEPRNPQVREALGRVMAKAPVREPIRTQDGDPKRHHQHRVLQMGPKKVSGL
jgi:hypothetical protein